MNTNIILLGPGFHLVGLLDRPGGFQVRTKKSLQIVWTLKATCKGTVGMSKMVHVGMNEEILLHLKGMQG